MSRNGTRLVVSIHPCPERRRFSGHGDSGCDRRIGCFTGVSNQQFAKTHGQSGFAPSFAPDMVDPVDLASSKITWPASAFNAWRGLEVARTAFQPRSGFASGHAPLFCKRSPDPTEQRGRERRNNRPLPAQFLPCQLFAARPQPSSPLLHQYATYSRRSMKPSSLSPCPCSKSPLNRPIASRIILLIALPRSISRTGLHQLTRAFSGICP